MLYLSPGDVTLKHREPLLKDEAKRPTLNAERLDAPCLENQRKFLSAPFHLFSRVAALSKRAIYTLSVVFAINEFAQVTLAVSSITRAAFLKTSPPIATSKALDGLKANPLKNGLGLIKERLSLLLGTEVDADFIFRSAASEPKLARHRVVCMSHIVCERPRPADTL